jgi:GTP cyclohydrolase II
MGNMMLKIDYDILRIRRAINDLKTNIPIYLRDLDVSIFSPEIISKYDYSCFAGSEDYLLLSAQRARYLNIEHQNIIIPTKDLSLDQIKDLIMKNDSLAGKLYEIAPESYSNIIKIMKLMRFLPAAIIRKGKPEYSLEIDSEEILRYYSHVDCNLYIDETTTITIKGGVDARLILFRTLGSLDHHYAIIIGDISQEDAPLTRLHSSCFTGDVLGSMTCDCQDQLHKSINYIIDSKGRNGVILYLMQDGRGIGTVNKMRAYNLQHDGLDTVEANLFLGYDEDERNFAPAVSMIEQLNISSITLLTNNPKKLNELRKLGINIAGVAPITTTPNKINSNYLKVKAEKMNHQFIYPLQLDGL